MAEFNANAITLVGNFSGPCLIYLNGESITVKRSDNYEIAKWPYIVIRQFRAEEEQGRFSFVSGRRGPYGVAEYNFILQKSMLNELQEALTQFTGAHFSNVAPGSGLRENPPPVPTSHRPSHTNPLHPSPSITSINSVGSTTSYDSLRGRSSLDMGYSSPSHARAGPPPVLTGPRLPPRDYLPSPLQQGVSPPPDSRYVRGPGQRSSHSASDSKQHSASPPTPSHSHPSTPSHQHNGWVLKSSTYETRRSIPRPKHESTNGIRGQSPTLREEANVPIDPPQLPPKYISASMALPTNDTSTKEGEVPKKSSYDHLTLSQEHEAEQVPQRPLSQPETSEDLDSSNLDFHPRRSPQLGTRSITPEEARLLHHVNSVEDDGDIIINKSPTIRGRRSPEDKIKRAKTERVISPQLIAPETYDVPPKRLTKQHSADDLGSGSHYHVPKPASNGEYHVPRPYDDSRNKADFYHQPKAAEETYKAPRPYEKDGPTTYDSPKHAQEQFYSTPRPLTENVVETDNFYTNVLASNEPTQEQFYSVPRTPTAAKTLGVSGDLSHQNPGNLYNSPRRGNSEKVSGSDFTDGGSSLTLHKLRPARSAESLATRRVIHNHSAGHISPPDPNTASEHNMYVDIDRKQPAPTADNLYAEIPADYIPRRIQLQSSAGSLVPQPSASAQDHYDQVPSRNASQLQKQRALATEGYELFLSAEVNPESIHTMTLPSRGKRASASPPKLVRCRGTSLEKYDIGMPAVRGSRPRSEADMLESSDTQKLAPGHGVDVLGSSIPTESSFAATADEYVIITHKDTRPKFPPTQPQRIPGMSAEAPATNQTAGDQSDEYQLMSAVKINRAELKASSLYDTPNPSLSSNSHQSGVSQSEELVQDNQYEIVNTSNYQSLTSESSLNMEGASPRSSRQLDQVRSMSFGSVFSSDQEVEGQVEQDGGVSIPQKARLRIASGSPRDSTSSMDLKNRSRSLGNVLDPTKKHNYINVYDNDQPSQSIEEKIRTSSLATAAMTKPPMPLPKPAALAGKPGDSPKQGRHGYESVDISKVKGNAHPLSSDAVTPQ